MRTSLLLLCFLLGCGRSELHDPATSTTTLPPQPLNESCDSSCVTSPTGMRTPLTTSGDRPLHWAHCGRCIEVTVDSTLPAATAAQVPAALDGWRAALGTGLCLRMAGIAGRPVGADVRRIHITPMLTDGPSLTLTTNRFEQSTGRMLNAVIELSSKAAPDRALTYCLGQALGLGRGENPKTSAMTSTIEGLTVPGVDDAASLRAMYGPPAWCTR